MGELRVEAKDADDQKHKKDVGLDDTREKFLPAGQLKGREPGVRKRKFRLAAIKASNLTAIQLPQQVVRRRGDEIDQLALQGFFVGKRLGIGDRSFCQRRVAPAFFRVAAQESQGVVKNFPLHGFVNLQ